MIFSVFVRYGRGLRLLLVLAAMAASRASVFAATTAEDVMPQLRDIMQGALTQSPRMVERNLSRLQAEQSLLLSSAALYPHVSASVNYQIAKENQTQDNPDRGWLSNNRNNFLVAISEPVLHWGEYGAAAEIGRIQAKIAANNVREAYRDLAKQIRSSYLQLIIDKASIRVGKFGEELARRRITVLQTRVASGELLAGADSGAQQDLTEALLAGEQRQAAFERSLRAFRRLTGNPDFSPDSLPEAIPEVPQLPADEIARAPELAAQGLESDGRHQNLSFQVKTEQLNLQIARVAQRPKIDGSIALSQDQLTYVSNVGQRTGVQSAYIGISVGWNIFDGRATRGRIQTTRTRLQILENQLAELTEDLRYAAEQSSLQIGFARRTLDNAETRYAWAVSGYNLTKDNFDRKRISNDDLDNARFSLNSAEIGLFSARATYLNAVSDWLYSLNADPAIPATIPPAHVAP